MFSAMIESLRQGEMPERSLLARRFAAAVTKKMAVVSLPPALWSADPKINPPAGQLFWAAIVLGVPSEEETAGAIVAAELAGRLRLSGEELQQHLPSTFATLRDEFLALAPNEAFRQRLAALLATGSSVPDGSCP